MRILSMGMTGDYEVAIEEGATMVRVGTGISARGLWCGRINIELENMFYECNG
mgnify:CR=1 FL=1